MCGRFYIAKDDLTEELARIIHSMNRKNAPQELKTSGEIFPSDVVPVLANSRKREVQPFAMRWGYSYPDNRPIINARSETASSKPLFKDGMLQRRCLIPASYYFEWERRDGRRIKHAIRPANSRMLYLAGIYHLENHSGVTVPTFVVLTREAAPEIAFIHNRMPVMMPSEHILDWLNVGCKADDLLRLALLDMEYQTI